MGLMIKNWIGGLIGGSNWNFRRGYTDSEILSLINSGYIPVASAADLYAIRTTYSGASTREFASGTKWATGQINTSGLSSKYIQVADIDLYAATRSGGAYYNSGAGWSPSACPSVYDGGGHIINGMYINKTTDNVGLFTGTASTIRNVANINVEIYASSNFVGGIVGYYSSTTPHASSIKRCIVTGFIRHTTSGKYYTGGIVGGRQSADKYCDIEDCFTNVDIYSGAIRCGGIVGYMADNVCTIKNCISLGKIRTAYPCGAIVGLINGVSASPIITNCYFSPESSNIDYSVGSDTYTTGNALSDGARSIEELTSGIKSDWLFNNWSSDYWVFRKGCFPILKIFGLLPVFMPGVGNVNCSINEDDKVKLTWEKPLRGEVLGYDIYLAVNDIFTKLNAELITTESFEHIPSAPGLCTFYINTLFSYNGFQIWSGGGEVIKKYYYLPTYAQVVGGEIWIADARFPDNTTYHTKIGGAVACEYEGVEEEITAGAVEVVEGIKSGSWLGAGSKITRIYDDAKRAITQVIDVEERRIIISNNITYKTAVDIDYEGFKFTGHVAFNNKINVCGSGSGQHIINSAGMFFHNGNYTRHRSLTSIGTYAYKYKSYTENDTESNKLYLMDGRDFNPVRVLAQPDGHDGTLCITNHADGDTQQTRSAIWFGASIASDSAYGKKGFIARGIKADWSVFTVGVLQWYQTPEYKAFLHTIKDSGNEIIPHGLQVSRPISRSIAETYLPLLKNEYAPSNWIDHSLGDGADTMGFCSKGWDITDPDYYALDLLEENGFDKSWSYDDADKEVGANMWGFEHNIVFWNDHLKLPTSGKYVPLWNSSDKPFYRGWLDMNKVVNNCNIIIAHEYIGATGGASTRESLSGDTGKYTRTYFKVGDEYRMTTGFDALLQNIASKKTKGQIWNPTATDFIEYFLLLKKVTLELPDANTVKITNNNNEAINGFSLLICKRNISPFINGAIISKKDVLSGTICWFDLPVGETIINITEP